MPDTTSQDLAEESRAAAIREAERDKAQRRTRSKWLTGLAALVALGAIAGGAYYWFQAAHYVSTDNAYVGADTAAITPLVGGPVAEVLVRETEAVEAGQVLVILDDADARLALTRAQSDLAAAEADATRTRLDLSRRRALSSDGAVSADEITAAQNAYASARAALAAARAEVEQAELDLSRMTIRAPVAGIVSDKNVQIGQRVEAGRPLMVIAPVAEAFVDANFKENQLRRVEIGQPVMLTSDLYGDRVEYHGVVEGFSGGTGSAFSLIPAQNASGNWIKVIQRVPVRISLDAAELAEHPLRVGLSMHARIDISEPGVEEAPTQQQAAAAQNQEQR